jgi:hypothetical protein
MKTSTKLTLALGLAVVLVMVMVQGSSWLRPTATASAAYSDPVGFVKIDVLKDKFNQISIPMAVDDMRLNDEDDSATSVGDMLSSGLLGAGNPAVCPTIWQFDPSTGFYTIALYFDSGGSYPTLDGRWLNNSYVPSTMSLAGGDGYFLQRAADAGPSTQQPVILGDVEVADTVSIAIAGDGGTAAKFTMIGYPYPVDMGVNDAGFITEADGGFGGFPGTSDEIYKWDPNAAGGTGGFEVILLFQSGGSYPTLDGKWLDNTYNPSTMVMAPGEGFFYARYKTQSGFTWDVARPFDLD